MSKNMNTENRTLFIPFSFKNGIRTANKILMAPMTTWSSNDDYTVADEEIRHYEARVGEVGMVITGCTRVLPNGIGFTNEYGAYDDSFLPGLKRLAAAAKSGGAPALMQLYHAGNKAIPELIADGTPVSASAIELAASPFSKIKTVLTHELSHEEVLDIIKAFGEVTHRAIKAGFDGVELHGAHGFLLQNFFSPNHNRRTDEWGGSPKNRMRFAVEVLKEVQRVAATQVDRPFLIGYRISPEEVDGYAVADTYPLIDQLIADGVDYLHVSLHDLLRNKPFDDADGEKTTLELIVEHVAQRIPVIAAGSVKQAADAVKAVDLGLSMVAVGHALIINPDWVALAARGEKAEEVLSLSKGDALAIPKKLQAGIAQLTGWFQVKE
jgi:2,4-dienoyl-CoA reductase-like NADH-dependent reductase (Old Yellow Enzyme family)